jgi:hypothetical protein
LECTGVSHLAWERHDRAYVKMRQFRLQRGQKRADGGVLLTECNIAWLRRDYKEPVPARIQALTHAVVALDPVARSFFAQPKIRRMQEDLIRCEHELSPLREIVGILKKAGAHDPPASMRAARRGDYAELTTWLAQGYNLSAPIWKGYTSLGLAIFRRDLAGLSWLLALGASPAQVIEYHSYPWSEAGERVRRHGNLAAWQGALTPLCLATLINWPANVACLLAQGARPD